MDFIRFSKVINEQFETMKSNTLFKVDASRDELWQTYINAFTKDMNPIYLERTEHDCNCCKNFIRDVGNAVTINEDGSYTSIWDIDLPDEYQLIADTMAAMIKSKPIRAIFTHYQRDVGAATTHQHLDNGGVKTWNHFVCAIPANCVTSNGAEIIGTYNARVQVFRTGLNTISAEAVATILELIESNSLYRGEEHKEQIVAFQKLLLSNNGKDSYVWANAASKGAVIKNSVIGTLLIDLTEDKLDLASAVASFEAKVYNFKRPTKAPSQRMIDDASKTIETLGYTDSISRRLAVSEDINVSDVIFADKSTAKYMKGSVSDLLKGTAKPMAKNEFTHTPVTMEEFLERVIPNTTSLELQVTNAMQSNLMTLIAPVYPDAPNMLKWDNNFSWSYKGNVADSIAAKVRKAGGNTTGILRVSLAWSNSDDLDISCVEAQQIKRIYYGNKRGAGGGVLDVDMNAGAVNAIDPVENIVWNNTDMADGRYIISIDNFTRRTRDDQGFTVEVAFNNDEVYTFTSELNNDLPNCLIIRKEGNKLTVESFNGLVAGGSSKNVMGISTEQFQIVRLMSLSPNHWGNNNVGNKHFFFFLDGCKTDEAQRGFYNEFLNADLTKHSKVMEALGGKTKCEVVDEQLSGIGFSSTKETTFNVRADGRIYQVTI